MVSVDRIKGLSSGLAIKAPCRVATTAPVTLSGLSVVDGVQLASGDGVLVAHQADPVDNGVWVASTSSWSRRADADGSNDLVKGTLFTVVDGTQSGQLFQLVAVDPVLPGATAMAFAPKVVLNLGLTTGAGLVGADDASSGALWTTVQGFINKILSSAGASVIGFIQAGTGATARTSQAKMRELKSFDDFGAVGDGITDDTLAITNAIAGTGPVLGVPGEQYKYGGSVAFAESFTLFDMITAGENLHDTFRIQRDVSNLGTASDQLGAIIARNYVQAGVTHNEFGIFSVLNDYSTASTMQHVSVYGQATSLTAAGSPLWAAVFEVRNTTPTGGGSSVDHVLCGIEVDVCNALPYSDTQKKIGVEVIAFGGSESTDGFSVHAATGTWATGAYDTGGWRNGLRIYPNSINASLGSGVLIASDHAFGLNISGKSAGAAINLGASVDTTIGILINSNYTVPIAIPADKNIRLNGFGAIDGIQYSSAISAIILTGSAIGVTGHTTYTSATAGGASALPATPSGYFSFYVNGILKKVPYYA